MKWSIQQTTTNGTTYDFIVVYGSKKNLKLNIIF